MRDIELSEPPVPITLRQQVCAKIREGILQGRYPAGSLLSENRLAEEFQISRTPIREALRELAAGGLVRILPQRGVIVSEITMQDVAELYQLREALECFATRFAAEHITAADGQGFQSDHAGALKHLRADRLHDAYDASIRMHSRIFAMASNARLTRLIDELSDQVRRIGMLTMRMGRSAQSISEHGAIIAALIAADADTAERLMREHLRSDRDAVLQQIMRVGLNFA